MQQIWNKNDDWLLFFKQSKNFREALDTILKTKIKKSVETDYNNSAWPYKQADMNGYNRAIEEVIKLLDD